MSLQYPNLRWGGPLAASAAGHVSLWNCRVLPLSMPLVRTHLNVVVQIWRATLDLRGNPVKRKARGLEQAVDRSSTGVEQTGFRARRSRPYRPPVNSRGSPRCGPPAPPFSYRGGAEHLKVSALPPDILQPFGARYRRHHNEAIRQSCRRTRPSRALRYRSTL